MKAFIFVPLLCFLIPLADGHGRLIEPPSRASAWRYGFDTPHNYNDHELFCGGFSRQWIQNGGKCGVCGDAWDSKLPRPHEYGGTYGQGVIVRKYNPGGIMNIRVELTANHNGYFIFSLCPDYKNTTQYCLDKNILTLAKPQSDVEHKSVKYYPKEGNRVYEIKYRLPKMSCEHCVLQWRYIAGNNWGQCPNGTEAVGCGPQEEFRACADVTISGKNVPEMTPPIETTPPVYVPTTATQYPAVPTTTVVVPTELPTPEESYNPIVAIFISVITFLVVSLILFLLYIHYYQIGGRIKGWIKGDDSDTVSSQNTKSGGTLRSINFTNNNGQFPKAPPRTKKDYPPQFLL
ncbi:uncharacterized protein LOC108744522 isoform X2 [Agrilus planipennis]|uniref:Uncharacterized protein LOC108744522 isoform X2 n=1 Tax=Agrilus planipennis TaxID=224129 RepID=A0A7F5RDY5_AGRPL|nr:uncharacterized protein LOC108744522 isoform X2 [Agrilus planipennis]